MTLLVSAKTSNVKIFLSFFHFKVSLFQSIFAWTSILILVRKLAYDKTRAIFVYLLNISCTAVGIWKAVFCSSEKNCGKFPLLISISIFTGEFYIKWFQQVPTIELDWNPLQVQGKYKNINMLWSKCAMVNNYMQHGIEFRLNSST